MHDWSLVFRAFGRALLNSLHPKVLLLTLWPLLASSAVFGLVWWQGGTWVLTRLQGFLLSLPWVQLAEQWLAQWGVPGVTQSLAQAAVLLACLSAAVVVALIVVSVTLTPVLVSQVANARFSSVVSLHRVPWWSALWWSLSSTGVALVWWLLSMPFWLLPLGSVLLPPLVWGWLTFRVLGHDVLAEHALDAERDALLRQHRVPLLFMGVVSAYLGAAPANLLMLSAWAAGALGGLAAGTGVVALNAVAAVTIPLAIGAAVWIYTMVFTWSSLWFAHYLLEALRQLRQSSSNRQASSNATTQVFT